jgi:hypothetical protein
LNPVCELNLPISSSKTLIQDVRIPEEYQDFTDVFSKQKADELPDRAAEVRFGPVRPVTPNAERSVRFGSNTLTNRNLPGSLSGRQVVKISNICGQKWKNTKYFCLGPCARALRCLPTKWRSREFVGIDACEAVDLDDV